MAHRRNSFCGRTRREFLWEMGAGFTGVALSGLLDGAFFPARAEAAKMHFANPLAPKPSPRPAKAKSVIFLFMYGGPSQVDTFDYKPAMIGMDNKTVKVKTFGRGGHKNQGRIVEPRWKFKQYGQCGKWVSDLFPHLGGVRRRHRVHPLDDRRFAAARLGDAADELAAKSSAALRAWARGSTTAWAASTRICRASS